MIYDVYALYLAGNRMTPLWIAEHGAKTGELVLREAFIYDRKILEAHLLGPDGKPVTRNLYAVRRVELSHGCCLIKGREPWGSSYSKANRNSALSQYQTWYCEPPGMPK